MTYPVVVAVVSWNTRELLAECLASLRPDHDAGRAEVWVVDNASTDGSARMVEARFPWVRLIESARNLGFGAAVQLVAARTQSPWIVAANSDVRVAPGALGALLAVGARRPHAGSLAPRLVLPGGEIQHSVHPFPSVGLGLLLASGLARVPALGRRLLMEGAWDGEAEQRVDWAHGAFLCLRRNAWDEVGGFDPAQWLYAEDLDLAWRLAGAGWRTVYVPAAVVHHHVSASTAQRWTPQERAIRTQRSTYAWLARRRGLGVTRATALANLSGPLMRIPLYAAAVRIAPLRYGWRRDRNADFLAMHRTGLASARVLSAHREAEG